MTIISSASKLVRTKNHSREFQMKKILLLSSALLIQSNTASANTIDIQYQPEPDFYDQVWDVASNWIRKQFKKDENTQWISYAGQSPYLNEWRDGSNQWEPGACLSSLADNSGVWINKPYSKKQVSANFMAPFRFDNMSSSYQEFVIGANTPYELESKNYTSAGIKQFFKYFYSFRINDLSTGTSTVIDNKNKHDYTAMHNFKEGVSWVYSTTFSDFEVGISIGNSSTDFNYLGSWTNASNYKVRGTWGTEIYLSDCGFAKVTVEKNTKPSIGSLDYTVGVAGTRPNMYRRFSFSAAGVTDKHSTDENLTYIWNIGGATYYSKTVVIGRAGVRDLNLVDVVVSLTVSDGDLSTVMTKAIKW